MTAPEFDSRSAPAWCADGFMLALGAPFSVLQTATPLPQPHWVARCDALAAELGWSDWLRSEDALQLLAGHTATPGGSRASVYSGHQFGQWAGQLGDGRALLLGEAQTPLGRVEVQLKGAGLTPYSRMGDGRAVLRSSIREFLCSEAMHGLRIPTTRALALVGSPAPVRRETVETAAVLTRTAPSFLRFGHFEHFTHSAQDEAALKRLADATIARFYPALQDQPQPYAALLRAVAEATARLLAHWQAVGFCHGVMNTDNMSMLGLTIDYGPFGFLDVFDPGHICNHTDHAGRYAFAGQPNVAFWNLHALAQALMPLMGTGEFANETAQETAQETALAALEPYKTVYPQTLLALLRAKLGLLAERDDDQALVDDLFGLMAADRTDFSITWRRLAGFASTAGAAQTSAHRAVRDLFIDREKFDAWGLRYAARLQAENSLDTARAERMNRVNPKFVLRNHLAETAIQKARSGDFAEVQRLLAVLQHPFDEQPENQADAGFPPDWATTLEVSCSS